ncbi:hypothetical protein HMPREF9370_0677 [Neisseria wadsworthii 9715]|uniref:Uncharacterized protein n=1 Tax=Neisseria wadsworthii 9715 TaxID=1030841 RepID=G4CNL8_9NEIS|nr:hypothetical protein HMPREF9370_0677 [Neisseria wadsworthii 9715]
MFFISNVIKLLQDLDVVKFYKIFPMLADRRGWFKANEMAGN